MSGASSLRSSAPDTGSETSFNIDGSFWLDLVPHLPSPYCNCGPGERLSHVGVVQADRWLQAHPSVTLCPLPSTLMEAPLVRIGVEPSERNGLRKPSQLMVDKLFTFPIIAIGAALGQLEPHRLQELDLALRGWL